MGSPASPGSAAAAAVAAACAALPAPTLGDRVWVRMRAAARGAPVWWPAALCEQGEAPSGVRQLGRAGQSLVRFFAAPGSGDSYAWIRGDALRHYGAAREAMGAAGGAQARGVWRAKFAEACAAADLAAGGGATAAPQPHPAARRRRPAMSSPARPQPSRRAPARARAHDAQPHTDAHDMDTQPGDRCASDDEEQVKDEDAAAAAGDGESEGDADGDGDVIAAAGTDGEDDLDEADPEGAESALAALIGAMEAGAASRATGNARGVGAARSQARAAAASAPRCGRCKACSVGGAGAGAQPRARCVLRRLLSAAARELGTASQPCPPCGAALALRGAEAVGTSIRVHWPLDKAWYGARLVSYDPLRHRHTVLYHADGAREALELWAHAICLATDEAPVVAAGASARRRPPASVAPRRSATTAAAGAAAGLAAPPRPPPARVMPARAGSLRARISDGADAAAAAGAGAHPRGSPVSPPQAEGVDAEDEWGALEALAGLGGLGGGAQQPVRAPRVRLSHLADMAQAARKPGPGSAAPAAQGADQPPSGPAQPPRRMPKLSGAVQRGSAQANDHLLSPSSSFGEDAPLCGLCAPCRSARRAAQQGASCGPSPATAAHACLRNTVRASRGPGAAIAALGAAAVGRRVEVWWRASSGGAAAAAAIAAAAAASEKAPSAAVEPSSAAPPLVTCGAFYGAQIEGFDPRSWRHALLYDDGAREALPLWASNECVRWEGDARVTPPPPSPDDLDDDEEETAEEQQHQAAGAQQAQQAPGKRERTVSSSAAAAAAQPGRCGACAACTSTRARGGCLAVRLAAAVASRRAGALLAREATHAVGRRVEIFWPLDGAWYPGTVDSYDSCAFKHSVLYDGDGMREHLALWSHTHSARPLPPLHAHGPRWPAHMEGLAGGGAGDGGAGDAQGGDVSASAPKRARREPRCEGAAGASPRLVGAEAVRARAAAREARREAHEREAAVAAAAAAEQAEAKQDQGDEEDDQAGRQEGQRNRGAMRRRRREAEPEGEEEEDHPESPKRRAPPTTTAPANDAHADGAATSVSPQAELAEGELPCAFCRKIKKGIVYCVSKGHEREGPPAGARAAPPNALKEEHAPAAAAASAPEEQPPCAPEIAPSEEPAAEELQQGLKAEQPLTALAC